MPTGYGLLGFLGGISAVIWTYNLNSIWDMRKKTKQEDLTRQINEQIATQMQNHERSKHN